jgi:iron complex transport system ATP-binding protein
MRVEVRDVSVTIDGNHILRGVSTVAEPGQFLGIVGPNGSGKSTLLRTLYRSVRPDEGSIWIGGDDVWAALTARQAAKRRAIVAQDSALDFDFSVADVVAMGRAPHKSMFVRDTNDDRRIVEEALDAVGMTWATQRLVATLSGGERQRVFLARALAQRAPVLVLDEPTNHLDVRAQLELLELVRSLGLTTIAALHDLDHAVSYCDAITVLHGGRTVAHGSPTEVLTPNLVLDVFGVRAHIGEHPLTGRPHITVAPTELVTSRRSTP